MTGSIRVPTQPLRDRIDAVMLERAWSPAVIRRPLAIAITLALAVAGTVFGALPHAAPPIIGPMIFSFTLLTDFAVAATLLFFWKTCGSSKHAFVLALSYIAGGTLTLLTLFSVPLLPQIGPILKHSPPGIWIYVLTHTLAACGTLCYVRLRAVPEATASGSFVIRASLLSTGFFTLATTGIFVFGAHLPQLANGVSVTGFRTSGIGISLLLAFMLIMVLALRLPQPTTIDRALILAQLALGFDVLMTLINGDRFSMSFYCSRALQFTASLFVLDGVLQSTVLAHRSTRSTLSGVERESTKRAARITALWQIGAAQDLPDEPQARFARMLEIAAEAIRPGRPFVASLSHLDRGALVFDAVVGLNAEPADPMAHVVRSRAELPLASTFQSVLYADGVTKAWDDIQHSTVATAQVARHLGTRAIIGSPLQIGRHTHFIVFSSPEPMARDPFDQSDIAYLDVVASLFSSTFTQIDQVGRLRFQMEHDSLTGLKNRVEFRKSVRLQIATGIPFVVAIANLDDFRLVNEVNGQMIADEVLVEISVALNGVNSADLVARLSGDEFGILIHHIGDAKGLAGALASYEEPFRRPFHTGDRDGTRMLSVGACLGAARFPNDGQSPEELVHAAGVALHVAKDHGHGSTVLYERAMEHHIDQRRTASTDIANAIVKDELRLVYQPSFDLMTRTIIGAEALVRWDHPEKGEIEPAHFIPVAEKYGVISDISRWVLRRLLRDLGRHELPPGFRCYFNLSTQDLENASLLGTLTEAIALRPALSQMLGVEITETGVMKNIDRSCLILEQIRLLGVRVAIDDFGTGHSSLSYLKQLSVDVIKIDRSFVTGLPGSNADAALTDSMIGLCKRLNLLTLAEGIETEEQRAWLLKSGCNYGQGYLVSRPVSFDELLTQIASEHHPTRSGG